MPMFSWFRRLRPKEEPAAATLPAPPVTKPEKPKSITSAMLSELAGLLRVGKRRPAATEAQQRTSFKLPPPFPGVLPSGAPVMAQDSQISAVYNFGVEASGGWDGYGFMGYALLAELAQIPEFRKPSEILANEMTRKWVKLISTGDDDKTEKLKDLEDEFERLGVQEAFRKAFEGDNFFGRMQIFPVIKGVEGDDLKTPLDVKANVERDSLEALRVIEPIWTYPNDYNSVDPTAANFYKPQSWFVLSQQIHASRLMTIVSRPVPDILKPAYLFGGVSLTQLLQPYVQNWLRTRQSVSDITHNFSTPVFKTDLGKLTEPGGAQLLWNRINVFNTARDNQGAMVVDFKNEDFVNVSAPLSGLDKLQAQAQEQMAAIAGIPLVKLFGITPSGLNASSDGEIRAFYDTIESTQERIGTPHLRRLLDLIQMSKFGMIDPDIGFVWQPLWSLDEKGLAEVRKINAETDGTYVDHGILDLLEVRQTLAAEENSRYASINVDELPDPPPEEDDGEGDEEGGGDAPDVRDAPDAHLRNSGEKKPRGGEDARRPFAHDAEFNEGDHPRASNGQFGSGGSSGSASAAASGQPKYQAGGISFVDKPPAKAETSDEDFVDENGNAFSYSLSMVRNGGKIDAVISGLIPVDDRGEPTDTALTKVQRYKLEKAVKANVQGRLEDQAEMDSEAARWRALSPKEQAAEISVRERAAAQTEQQHTEVINRTVDEAIKRGWRPDVNHYGGWKRPEEFKQFDSPKSEVKIKARLAEHGVSLDPKR